MNKLYSDLSITFRPHPATGDVTRVFDYASITQAIKVLVLGYLGERPYSSLDCGSRIRDYLFDIYDPTIVRDIKEELTSLILRKEPRVFVRDVLVNPDIDQYRLAVAIIYSFKTTPERLETVNVVFTQA